ncbi:TetR family transcriptional regulator [Actinoplanes sp. NPDC026619]|uniref:TetR/AcrR family transcriptional regulator n=1 Tax=Actinoplanes sp. NPDC026619 TaxID=3155798 RepID=UPI0033D3768F
MTDDKIRRRAPGMSPGRRREMIVAAAVPLLVEHGAAVSTLQIAKAAGIGEATIFRAFTDKDDLLHACVVAVLRNDQVLAELDAVPLDQPLAARLVEAAATLRAYLDRMGAVIAAVHSAASRGLAERHARPGDSAHGPDHGAAHGPDHGAAHGLEHGAAHGLEHGAAHGLEHGAAHGLEHGAAHGLEHGAAHGPEHSAADGSGHSAAPRPSDGGGGRDERAEAVELTRQAVIRLLEPDRDNLRLPLEQVAAIFLGLLFPRRGTPAATDTPIETLVDVFLHGAAGERPAA